MASRTYATTRRRPDIPVMPKQTLQNSNYHNRFNSLPTPIVADFLRAVREPGTSFTTLQQFLDALEQNAEKLTSDLLRHTSGAEIATLLNDAQKLKAVDIALIFAVLEKIVLTMSTDPTTESFVMELAEELISKHGKTFYYMLKTTNKSNQMKSALKLLIALATLGNRSVKLILTHFNFASGNISNLVTRRNTVDPQDVRASTLHFIIAMLMFGDSISVRLLVETKGVLASFFHGLVVDRSELIHLFLSTLLDRVVKNMAISKTTKILLFNQTSLKQVSRLFLWSGHKKSEKEFVEDAALSTVVLEERTRVKDMALHFLTEVCSSSRFGIVFQDRAFGSGPKNCNHVLTELLRTLSPSSSYHRQLAKSILVAAPDQLTHFLPSWKPGFVPRESEKWIEMMGWLSTVYEALNIPLKLVKVAGPSRVQCALALFLPSFIDNEMLIEGFAEKQPAEVSSVFLKFLYECLLRAYKMCLLMTPNERKDFLRLLSQRVVDPQLVASCYRKARTKMDQVEAERKQLIEEQYVRYLLLDGRIFKRENEAAQIEDIEPSLAEEFTQKMEKELASFEAEFVQGSEGVEIFQTSRVKAERNIKEKERHAASERLRTQTAQLLLHLVDRSCGLLDVRLMDILLSSYGGTLSEADQTILCILQRSEDIDTPVHLSGSISYSAFGRLGQKLQQRRERSGVSLAPEVTLAEFMDGLQQSTLQRTVIDFPVRLPLNRVNVEFIDGRIYDPAYLLANFFSLLQGPKVNITSFVESGCLGFLVSALASLDRDVRGATCACLKMLEDKIDPVGFRGKEQLRYILQMIRRANNVDKPWPSLWTNMLQRFFMVMLDSRNHMYQIIMEFLLTKPVPNLNSVPEFYKLFESGDLAHVKERTFILEILRDGVRHFNDYEICSRTHVWEMVMTLYNSPLSTPTHNLLVTEVFLAASQVPFVGRALVKSHGLFTWLAYHLRGTSEDVQLVDTLVLCARNCMADLLRSKRRAVYDAQALLSPLLRITKLGLPADTQKAILQFTQSLLLFHPSAEPLKCLLTTENLSVVVDTGVSLVGSSRLSTDNATWRQCCERAVKAAKLLSVGSLASEFLIWNLSLFLSVVLSDEVTVLASD